jgi:hypothetical protein
MVKLGIDLPQDRFEQDQNYLGWVSFSWPDGE